MKFVLEDSKQFPTVSFEQDEDDVNIYVNGDCVAHFSGEAAKFVVYETNLAKAGITLKKGD